MQREIATESIEPVGSGTTSDQVVRASSSLVENLNSRLQSDFFLRRQLANDDLTLLQLFLNHR
jgi:hypothetical protein